MQNNRYNIRIHNITEAKRIQHEKTNVGLGHESLMIFWGLT